MDTEYVYANATNEGNWKNSQKNGSGKLFCYGDKYDVAKRFIPRARKLYLTDGLNTPVNGKWNTGWLGIFFYLNGDKYTDISKTMFQGKGKYTWADGSEQEGLYETEIIAL
jgi:hypothetical protein